MLSDVISRSGVVGVMVVVRVAREIRPGLPDSGSSRRTLRPLEDACVRRDNDVLLSIDVLSVNDRVVHTAPLA
jgi:hypothetical protein